MRKSKTYHDEKNGDRTVSSNILCWCGDPAADVIGHVGLCLDHREERHPETGRVLIPAQRHADDLHAD